MLTLTSISKSYINGTTKRQVLQDLNLSVNRGDAIAITGPSGSGKTTLLTIIGSLETIDAGSVMFGDVDLSKMKQKERLAFRNGEIGFVFQEHSLLPQCTLWENVLLPVLAYQKNTKSKEGFAEELLKQLDLWELRNQKPAELSGGECQRAALARAMILKPSLLLADEPTGALDHVNAEILGELLLKARKEWGVTVIVATHSSALAQLMDKQYTLTNGGLK